MKVLPLARAFALSFTVIASFGAHAATPVTPGQAVQSVQPRRAIPIDNTVQLPELIGAAARPGAVPPGGTPIAITSIDFTGNTKIASATLQQRVAQFVGKSLTLAELYAVAADLTRFYQSQGYPLASVNVPVQRVAGGKVLLEVTEGRIGKVRVETKGGHYRASVFEEQLRELASGDVVTSAQLEREILLLNDLPGIEARVVVVPGAEAGTSDLVVQVVEDSFAFYVGADNHGREDIGRARLSFNMYVNGLGRGDDLTLNLTQSEDDLLNYGRIAYSMPISTNGERLSFSYLLTDYANGDPTFALLHPEGKSSTIRGEYSYPLQRSRLANEVLVIGYATTSTETRALGAITSSTEVSLLDVTLFGNKVLGDRRTMTWSYGFSGNGQYNTGTPGESDQQCCKLSGDYSITGPVAASSYQKLKLRAQWAPDRVADIERFSLGGPYSVRGYEASEIRGDSGFEASWELHTPVKVGGGTADFSVFGDVGQASTNLGSSTVQSSVLGSVGATFTMYDVYGFDLNLTYASALGGYDPADGNRDRFYVSAGGRF